MLFVCASKGRCTSQTSYGLRPSISDTGAQAGGFRLFTLGNHFHYTVITPQLKKHTHLYRPEPIGSNSGVFFFLWLREWHNQRDDINSKAHLCFAILGWHVANTHALCCVAPQELHCGKKRQQSYTLIFIMYGTAVRFYSMVNRT